MARQGSGLAAITDYIRRNPRTAAIAAFNLGLYAASLTRKGVRRSDLKDLPSKLVELVPGMRDLVSLVPMMMDREEPPRTRRKSRTRKPVSRSTRRKESPAEPRRRTAR
jgi:hypothetical protein